MKKTLNLIDDPRPGGIRSLLDDIDAAGLWPCDRWEVRTVNPVVPVASCMSHDVIVVHYSMAWRKLPGLMFLRAMHPYARLVIVEHHYTQGYERQFVTSRRRFHNLLRTCYGLADCVVAVSHAQADWLRSLNVVSDDKLRTIPACRNYARFLSIERATKRFGPVVVGALGRIEHAKGFDLLIRAFAGLPASEFRLRIAGDGSQRESLQQLAADLPHVEFVGHLDDPAPFLASCDVLAMPSRNEAFGLSCAEGKASGLPVVVSDVDALPDQARNCGLVVETGNVNALRDALVEVARPEQRAALGRKARASVVDAWPQYLSSWSRLLA
ncbi:MAG: glycosyltransferase family 4 protein [Pseudomonadota bacterium]